MKNLGDYTEAAILVEQNKELIVDNIKLPESLGIGQVIAGWDEGILLLNKGAAARLLVPSYLGYGARGAGEVIPPDTTLIFDVELVDF